MDSQLSLIVMAVITLSLAWLYFLLLGRVPLLDALKSSNLGALQQERLMRDPYVNHAQAKVPLAGFLEAFRNIGTPALFAATAVQMKVRRRPYHYLLLALCTVTVLAAGQRWPLQYLLLTTFIALLAWNVTSIWRIGFFGGILGLVAGAVLTVAQGRATGEPSSSGSMLGSGVLSVFNRFFSGYVELPIMSYDMPSVFPHALVGASYLQSLMAFAPGPGVSYAVTFYNLVLGIDSGYTASPDFATELYLNFRLPGVLLGTLLWVRFLRRIDKSFQNRRMTPVGAGLWAMTVLCLGTTTTEGLVSSALRPLIVIPPILLGIWVTRQMLPGTVDRKDCRPTARASGIKSVSHVVM